MTRHAPEVLPSPTLTERAAAAHAARALRLAIADPSTMGAPFSYHVDLSRPRRGLWVTTWANLPGFSRINGRFQHDCLPGWEYTRLEVRLELILDLELLAERGVRPTEATTDFSDLAA